MQEDQTATQSEPTRPAASSAAPREDSEPKSETNPNSPHSRSLRPGGFSRRPASSRTYGSSSSSGGYGRSGDRSGSSRSDDNEGSSRGSGNFRPRTRLPFRRKFCFFTRNHITYIDYKDTLLLKRFLGRSGQILSPRITSVKPFYQRKLALAIKRARYMALIPYVGEIVREEFGPRDEQGGDRDDFRGRRDHRDDNRPNRDPRREDTSKEFSSASSPSPTAQPSTGDVLSNVTAGGSVPSNAAAGGSNEASQPSQPVTDTAAPSSSAETASPLATDSVVPASDKSTDPTEKPESEKD